MYATDTSATVPAGLWLSITDLAKERGVTKQTIAAKVARFEGQGLLSTRSDGPGRPKLVNVAAFDRAVGETGDAVRTLAAASRRSDTLSSPAGPEIPDSDAAILQREQARRAQYVADIAQLDRDERLKKLIPIDEVTRAMVRCAESMVRIIDRLPSRADDLATAVARDGAHGARQYLKDMARDLREQLAQEMRLMEGEGRSETDADGGSEA